jgi:glutamyl-Q tRNA(Asp) synthetase
MKANRVHPAKTDAVFRFAPSPTGYLHLGHAFAAWYAFEAAHAQNGRFLLRIEDIDLTRCRPHFEEAIYEDLNWLGLHWELPVRRQSCHMDDYQKALDDLRIRDLVYPCFCTRRELAATRNKRCTPDGTPLYPGTCRQLSRRECARRMADNHPYQLRLDMTAALRHMAAPLAFFEEGMGPTGEHGLIKARPDLFGDTVIARKDAPASYHLCVVVDDALQGITTVTRGEDLFPATHFHRLLQALLGLPVTRYRHHRLIRDEKGIKLSKHDKATGLRALRADGVTSEQIFRWLGCDKERANITNR